jgi:hypothetical protein
MTMSHLHMLQALGISAPEVVEPSGVPIGDRKEMMDLSFLIEALGQGNKHGDGRLCVRACAVAFTCFAQHGRKLRVPSGEGSVLQGPGYGGRLQDLLQAVHFACLGAGCRD